MKKIIEARIVEGEHISALCDNVNHFIDDGWEPIGQPFFKDHTAYWAMVRKEEEIINQVPLYGDELVKGVSKGKGKNK